MPDERADWAAACQASIQRTAVTVTVRHCPGIAGDYFGARRGAYRLGTAPYVSFVDPDDEVLPGAFEHCLARLESDGGAVAVYTRSLKWCMGLPHRKEVVFPWPHQLIVARRDAVLPLLDAVSTDKDLALELGRQGRFVRIDWFGYVWRDHPVGLHRVSHAKLS